MSKPHARRRRSDGRRWRRSLIALALFARRSAQCSPRAAAAARHPRARAAATSTTRRAALERPGAGKPAVTIGDKNFTEENILGALYAQALQAKGYKVTLKDNIGSSEIIYKALTSGRSTCTRSTRARCSRRSPATKEPASAAAAYNEAKAFVEEHGARCSTTRRSTTPMRSPRCPRTRARTTSRASPT